MAQTFAQMKASVRAVCRDTDAAFLSDAQLGEWINEGYLDLCVRLSLLQTNAAGTTSAQSTITLPADLYKVNYVSVDVAETEGIPVVTPIYVSNETFHSYADGGVTPGEYIYRIYEGLIDIFPVAADKPYVLEYIEIPTPLTGTDTTTIQDHHDIRLINYARAEAKLMEGELTESQMYRSKYEQGLPGPVTDTARLHPGPTVLIPVPQYWDDPYGSEFE